MAGQKKATKLEYLKLFEQFEDNDVILIDTRKDNWIKKIGNLTPLLMKIEFTDEEKEAIRYACSKANREGKNIHKLPSRDAIIHMFIGSDFNRKLCKSNTMKEVDAKIVELYNRFEKVYGKTDN